MQTDTKADVLQGALDRAQFAGTDQGSGGVALAKNEGKAKKRAVSPITGAPTPPGRPVGVRNKLTNLRDAVLQAFEMAGGAQYLYQLSQGTQSDRAAFVGLMSKVLPTQINQEVTGGIQIQLSWLGQRSIGTVTAQAAEQITQVVDLQRDEKGKYRIAEPSEGEQGVSDQGAAASAGAQADPPSPLRSGGGGGG